MRKGAQLSYWMGKMLVKYF